MIDPKVIPAMILSSLFVLVIVLLMVFLRLTKIGEEGYKNQFVESVLMGAAFMLGALICTYIYSIDHAVVFLIGAMVALVLLICEIAVIRGLLKEVPGDLTTETLTNLYISSNQRIFYPRHTLYGITEAGMSRTFLITGVDTALTWKIIKEGINRVTITYHRGNRRIHSIKL